MHKQAAICKGNNFTDGRLKNISFAQNVEESAKNSPHFMAEPAVKEKTLQLVRHVLQLKVFIRQAAGYQSAGAGRNPLQRIIAERPAVGAGGHNSFFGADDLAVVQLPSPGAVGTPGLNGCLKEIDGNSLPAVLIS